MATQSKGTKTAAAKPKAKAKAAPRRAKTAPRQAARPAAREKRQPQAVAESIVDVPVGAVLELSDRLSELIEPWSGRVGAERQLKQYRTELRRTLRRAERRGTSARHRATSEARRARTRVEREARKRQRSVRATLERNRGDLERRVRRAIDGQTARAQDLVDQVAEQLSALR